MKIYLGVQDPTMDVRTLVLVSDIPKADTFTNPSISRDTGSGVFPTAHGGTGGIMVACLAM